MEMELELDPACESLRYNFAIITLPRVLGNKQ